MITNVMSELIRIPSVPPIYYNYYYYFYYSSLYTVIIIYKFMHILFYNIQYNIFFDLCFLPCQCELPLSSLGMLMMTSVEIWKSQFPPSFVSIGASVFIG